MSPDLLFFTTLGSPAHTPVIFLHGFLGSHKDWLPFVRTLSGRYFIILVDLPGHGQSKIGSTAITLSSLANEIKNILDYLKIPSACWVGYSMGGRAALACAAKYPGLFRKLLLESSTPGILSEQDRAKRIETDTLWADKLETLDFGEFLKLWYSAPLFHSISHNPCLLERLLEERSGQDPGQLAKALVMLSAGAQEPLWDTLENLRFPITLLAGQKDPKFIRIAEEMKKRGNHIRISVIPDTGHNIHFENYASFELELGNFLMMPEDSV